MPQRTRRRQGGGAPTAHADRSTGIYEPARGGDSPPKVPPRTGTEGVEGGVRPRGAVPDERLGEAARRPATASAMAGQGAGVADAAGEPLADGAGVADGAGEPDGAGVAGRGRRGRTVPAWPRSAGCR